MMALSNVRVSVALMCVCMVHVSPALTIHRSFRARAVGFGAKSVSVPLDSRVVDALNEFDRMEAERTKVVIGRCTRVLSGDTIRVVTDGNVLFAVRLDRIVAPAAGRPYGKESSAALSKLIRGRNVRVEWVRRDSFGRLLGRVYLKNEKPGVKNGDWTDVNLHLVATGNARLSSDADVPDAYLAAESAAKTKHLGLWTSL